MLMVLRICGMLLVIVFTICLVDVCIVFTIAVARAVEERKEKRILDDDEIAAEVYHETIKKSGGVLDETFFIEYAKAIRRWKNVTDNDWQKSEEGHNGNAE